MVRDKDELGITYKVLCLTKGGVQYWTNYQ